MRDNPLHRQRLAWPGICCSLPRSRRSACASARLPSGGRAGRARRAALFAPFPQKRSLFSWIGPALAPLPTHSFPSLLYHLPFLHVDPCGLDLFLPSCPNTHPLHYFTFQCFAPLPIPCPTPTHIPSLLYLHLSRALRSWEPNTHTSLASQHTHPLPFSHTLPFSTFSSQLFLPLRSSSLGVPTHTSLPY